MTELYDDGTLATLLKRIGDFKMSTFEDRLKFQKRIYFLQVYGFDLGYPFNYYISGPYCKELAKSGFNIANKNLHDIASPFKFANPEHEKRFNEYLNFVKANTDVNKLELLSSIHFWFKSLDGNEEEVIKEVTKKDKFDRNKCKEAFSELKRWGLI